MGLLELIKAIFGRKAINKYMGTQGKVITGVTGKNSPFVNDWSIQHLKNNPELLQQAKEVLEKAMPYAFKTKNLKHQTQYRSNLQKIYDIENPPSAKVLDISSKKQVTGEGLESLKKEAGLVDKPGSPMANIQRSERKLNKALDELVEKALEMDPVSVAKKEAAEKAKKEAFLKRKYEGAGYPGLHQEGYHRAVVRPFLIDQHDKGIIKLSDEAYKSLKESSDLSSGGFNDFAFPDPVRVFRQHYGDDAFKRISPDIQSPARSDILESMYESNFKPIKKEGPKRPGGYLTKGEYQAKIEEAEDLVELYKTSDESWIGDLSKDERAKKVAEANLGLEHIKRNFKIDFPDEVLPADDTLWGFDPQDLSQGGIAGPLHLYEGGRVGMVAGGPAKLKKLYEGLFIKKSNEIRLGKGIYKGLTDKEKWALHDELTGIVDEYMKTGVLPEGAKKFIPVDDINKTLGIAKTTKVSDDVMNKAYDEVSHQLNRGDIKYEADVLAESIAEQQGKVYDDLADAERTELYSQAYQRVAKDLKMRMDTKKVLKEVEQKMTLSDFDTKGRKPNSKGGRVSMVKGGLAGVLGV